MRIVRRFVQGLALLALATGCGSPTQWMPLETGRSATYQITAGLHQFVEVVTVGKHVPVAGTNGYELTGKMGVRRMGWKGGTLYQSQSPTAMFIPALPLFLGTPSASWKGVVRWGDRSMSGTGATTMSDGTGEALAGCKVSTIRLDLNHHAYRLETVFKPGTGIIDQQQWMDDVSQFRMKLATLL